MALLLRSLALPRKRLPLAGILILALATYTLLTFNISDYSHLRPPSCDRLPIPPSKTNPAPSRLHPIPALMAEGNVKWAALLAAQSRNVSAAAGEYRRRYKLDPPDGFDLWFAYAQRTGVKLVDEYDIIMEALAPLRKLGKVEVRRRTDALLDYGFDNAIGGLLVDASNEVVTFVKKGKERKIRKRQGHVILEGEEEGGFRTKGLLLMLEPVKGVLAERAKRWPAFRVPVNELAEARVLDTQVPPKTSKVWIEELWHEHAFERRTMANDIAAACGEESMFAKRVVGTRFEIGIEEVVGGVGGGLEGEGKEPGFVVEPKVDNDICERPELMSIHGVFRGSRATTKGLYPMLSYGRPSAFGDIPIPSRYQWDEGGDYEYQLAEDIPWEEKNPVLYWRGEPSGGGHGDKYYGSMHRHRLVALTNPSKPHFKTNVTLTGATSSNLISYTTASGALMQTLTNVSFSNIDDACEMFGCDLRDMFPFEPRNRFSEAWKNKVVIDSDGWGPSGRWRALLASKSLAVRSSIYREWFGERMLPWVHYVPASVGLGELWGILGFFLGTLEEGGVAHDREARAIAEQGARWVTEHMRKQDMTVYAFRLVLELNRIFNGAEWVYKE